MRNNQTVALFADINNLYNGAYKTYQGRLDYERLYTQVSQYGNIVTALAYGIAQDSRIELFKQTLKRIGFECRWGPHNRYNWNVGITIDVVRQLDRVDLVAIASNDHNLIPTIEYVKKDWGLKCYTWGFSIPDTLREATDRFFEIPESMILTIDEYQQTG